MQIIISQLTDLGRLACCHKKAFPGSLSSHLGKRFIKKMLSWYIINDRGILFHVEDNNKVIGYCGGIIIKRPGLPGAATSITQHSFKTFISAFLVRPWLIFHPENLKRISFIRRNLMYKLGLNKIVNNKTVNKNPIKFKTSWGLVVIGVDPTYQGKGVGSLLLQEFEQLAKSDGVKKITLSVKPENLKAIKSYTKNGWHSAAEKDDSLNMYKEL
jgi:GNAT superfamily N-acetyltransferase